jgi:short-subunit dehydrogenase
MNILITGASKGIGKAITLNYCTKGNHALFLVSRDKKLLNELKIVCEELNSNCKIYIYPADISLREEVKILADEIAEIAGNIDILINNAGSLVNKKFGEFKENEIASMFQVNFFGPAQLIKNLIPALSRSEKARVINIGSMGGYQGSSKYPGLSYYSASKAAIGILTECLATEYENTRILFNCLALGAVQTDMFSSAFPGSIASIKADEMAEYIVEFSLQCKDVPNGKIIMVTELEIKK